MLKPLIAAGPADRARTAAALPRMPTRPGVSGWWNTVWILIQRQRERGQLGDLNDHLLADIGLDRVTAERIAAKPFWQR